MKKSTKTEFKRTVTQEYHHKSLKMIQYLMMELQAIENARNDIEEAKRYRLTPAHVLDLQNRIGEAKENIVDKLMGAKNGIGLASLEALLKEASGEPLRPRTRVSK